MSSTTTEIWHYNRCSKSRQTLQLLEEKGLEPKVRNYREEGPTKEELQDVLAKLELTARELARTKDSAFSAHREETSAFEGDDQWVDFLVAHPEFIERPVVIHGEKAALGRPPEKVLEIL